MCNFKDYFDISKFQMFKYPKEYFTPQKIPRQKGRKTVKIVDVQESYWSVLQSGKRRFTSSHFLGFRVPVRSPFSLTSPVGSFSRENPPLRPRLFHFPGKFRPSCPFSLFLTNLNQLTFSKSKESPVVY